MKKPYELYKKKDEGCFFLLYQGRAYYWWSGQCSGKWLYLDPKTIIMPLREFRNDIELFKYYQQAEWLERSNRLTYLTLAGTDLTLPHDKESQC